ncbi:hypothetical protein NEO01_22480, partial [Escherichia coli]|nr:hypothetical protein [Escherichia coli]
MKAIQCCYFLALVSSHLMAGVMGDDNIFLSNSDSAALYCVAKCVFRSIRSRIGIEVRSAIRIHSINRELNFFYR